MDPFWGKELMLPGLSITAVTSVQGVFKMIKSHFSKGKDFCMEQDSQVLLLRPSLLYSVFFTHRLMTHLKQSLT